MVVACLNPLEDVAEVACSATYTEQTRLLVEQVRQAFGVESFLVHDEGDGTGVDVARACAHNQSFKRS